MSGHGAVKVALTGDIALELVAPYFRKAGCDVYVSAGFGAWRQEVLDENSPLHRFNPDFIFDVTSKDATLSGEIAGFFDERMRALASMPYSLSGIEAIVEEFEFVRLSAPKKILAIDADNTLWQGVLAEDGEEGVSPYLEFQNGVKELADSGVALVLLSKYDSLRFREWWPLSEDDFASVKVNWRSKAENLVEACAELQLSADSAVFVDDNPAERAEMGFKLGEVAVVPFPQSLSSPRQFLRRLREYFFFNAGKTGEDMVRSADYAANRYREKLRLRHGSAEDYLLSLGLRAKVSPAGAGNLDRLEQLSQRSNQFNATTIRRSRADFAGLLDDATKKVFVAFAGDRFADQGLVAYVVVDLAKRRITDFVMSCRAMGRTLEHFVLGEVARALGFSPKIDFSPSAKNAPFAAFLESLAKGAKTYYQIANEPG
jgi:FkbH-like protein